MNCVCVLSLKAVMLPAVDLVYLCGLCISSFLSKQKILMEFSMLELEGTIRDPTGQATVSFVKFDSLVGALSPVSHSLLVKEL